LNGNALPKVTLRCRAKAEDLTKASSISVSKIMHEQRGPSAELKLKVKVSTGFHSRQFYSAAIAITAFTVLGVNLRKSRCVEDSNPGRWFRS